MNTSSSEAVYTCSKCKATFEVSENTDTNWFAYNIQKGSELEVFCSSACLQSWVKGKQSAMIITLVLGAILTALLFSEIGTTAIIVFFVPYMIRQYRNSLKDVVKNGWFGEFISFSIVLLSSMTIIYPIVKLIQEISEYKRIQTYIEASGGIQ